MHNPVCNSSHLFHNRLCKSMYIVIDIKNLLDPKAFKSRQAVADYIEVHRNTITKLPCVIKHYIVSEPTIIHK